MTTVQTTRPASELLAPIDREPTAPPAAEIRAWLAQAGVHEDELSGGGDALVVPKGAVRLGDYVLYDPEQTEDGIRRFGRILAVREGRVRRRWAVEPRPGTPARH